MKMFSKATGCQLAPGGSHNSDDVLIVYDEDYVEFDLFLRYGGIWRVRE